MNSPNIQMYLTVNDTPLSVVLRNMYEVISLYCLLSVQYLNYISIFQLIALN